MRIIFLTTAALLALGLTGCGNKPEEQIGNADKLYEMAKKPRITAIIATPPSITSSSRRASRSPTRPARGSWT